MSATQRKPDRSLILILGVIAALVIVALLPSKRTTDSYRG